MNLDKILKDVEEFERAKGKATQGEWFVLSQDGSPRCIGSKDYGVVPSSDCEWDASVNDLNFIVAAKNFPAETIIRDLVEEVKRLRQQLADNEAEKMIRWGHNLNFQNGSQISLPEKSEDKFQGLETHALLLPLEDE